MIWKCNFSDVDSPRHSITSNESGVMPLPFSPETDNDDFIHDDKHSIVIDPTNTTVYKNLESSELDV